MKSNNSKQKNFENKLSFARCYEIYTGNKFRMPLIRLSIMVVLLLAFAALMDKTGSSEFSFNMGTFPGSIVTLAGVFVVQICTSENLFGKQKCYYLTFQNRGKIYKGYYFSLFILYICSMVIYLAGSFLISLFFRNPSQKDFLTFLLQLESIFVIFGIIPFISNSQSSKKLILKSVILIFCFLFFTILWCKPHIIPVIILAAFDVPLMIFSIKYFIRKTDEMFAQ